ncbi:hypothetical protein SUDANB6_00671 [Streptomyces sp. enrichment culture]
MTSTAGGAGRLRAISDPRIGSPENRALAEGAHPGSEEDWLLVAGDVAGTAVGVRWAPHIRARRFRRVVRAPGNHELWTRPSDPVTSRGVARRRHLVDMLPGARRDTRGPLPRVGRPREWRARRQPPGRLRRILPREDGTR